MKLNLSLQIGHMSACVYKSEIYRTPECIGWYFWPSDSCMVNFDARLAFLIERFQGFPQNNDNSDDIYDIYIYIYIGYIYIYIYIPSGRLPDRIA